MKSSQYLAILTLLLPLAAWGQAGEVRFVQGDVQVERANGKIERLERGAKLTEGDTIITGTPGYVQLAMADEAVLAVRADTRLKLEAYRFSGQADGSEKSILGLIRGGFRSITGLIGRTNKDAYTVRTPTATIGIRGTDHETFVILPPRPGETPIGEPGTYDKVNAGETFIDTGNGRVQIQANQAGFAPATAGSVPVKLAQVPAFMRSTPQARPQQGGPAQGPGRGQGQGQGQGPGRGPGPGPGPGPGGLPPPPGGMMGPGPMLPPPPPLIPKQQQGTLDPLNLPPGAIAAPLNTVMAGGDLSNGQVGSGAGYVGNPDQPFAVLMNGAGQLLQLQGGNFKYSRDGAPELDHGSISMGGLPVNWGVYSGGTIQDGMGVRSPTYFHYMIGGAATTAANLSAAMPNINSTYTMNTVVGYTKPISESGIGGSVTSLNITLKNLSGSISVSNYQLGVTDASGRAWTGTLANAQSLSTFIQGGGQNLNASCSSCAAGITNGHAAGMAIGNPIAGFVSSYSLQQGSANVTGSVLSKP